MFNWLYKFVNKSNNSNKVNKYKSPIDRVKHKFELESFSEIPRRYSIYGVVTKDNKIHAVIHWQGFEDAGWKLIPIKDLDPFRLPDLSRVEFFYTKGISIHKWHHNLPSIICKVESFELNDLGELIAHVVFDNGVDNYINTEHLYDVNDPQFYGD